MFERFGQDARKAVVRAASEEAPCLGSASVQAEHLLLALAADEGSAVGRLLADSGLDHDGLSAALELETERSLASVGVALRDFPAYQPPATLRSSPTFAASSKQALQQALRVAAAKRDRAITAAHLLVGILRGDIGTIPRALDAAQVDRIALLARAEALVG